MQAIDIDYTVSQCFRRSLICIIVIIVTFSQLSRDNKATKTCFCNLFECDWDQYDAPCNYQYGQNLWCYNKPEFHLARHVTSRHDSTRSTCRARRDERVERVKL